MTESQSCQFNAEYLGGDPRCSHRDDSSPESKLRYKIFGADSGADSGKLTLSGEEIRFRSTRPYCVLSWPDVSLRSVQFRRTFRSYDGYTLPEDDILLKPTLRRQVDKERIDARERAIPAVCMMVDDPERIYPVLEIYFGVASQYQALVIMKRIVLRYPLVEYASPRRGQKALSSEEPSDLIDEDDESNGYDDEC